MSVVSVLSIERDAIIVLVTQILSIGYRTLGLTFWKHWIQTVFGPRCFKTLINGFSNISGFRLILTRNLTGIGGRGLCRSQQLACIRNVSSILFFTLLICRQSFVTCFFEAGGPIRLSRKA